MNICLVNGGFDADFSSVDELLDRYWHIPKLAEALADQGANVAALQVFSEEASVDVGGALFETVAPKLKTSGNWREISSFSDIADRVAVHKPDVVHVFGLISNSLCAGASAWARANSAKCTVSFHGGRPNRNPLRRLSQRRALASMSAFFFSNPAAAYEWRRARLLPANAPVTIAPELASPFSGIENARARSELGLLGNPLLVWAGHLYDDKDPMTVLEAMRTVIKRWPDARLAMAYQQTDLLPEVERFLAHDASLSERVALLGTLPHKKMETLFSAADFLVHTSRREYGSNVVTEAVSCGAIPIVTSLPSLTVLVENIGAAATFEPGDSDALADKLLGYDLDHLEQLRAETKSESQQFLSYDALACTYTETFRRIVGAGKNEASQ